jgi:hypothetical protein
VDDWGPLAGPWTRYAGNPIVMPTDRESGGGPGPQGVVYYRGQWRMFLMSVVDGEQNTVLLNSPDGLCWRRAEPYPFLRVTEPYEGRYALIKSAVVDGDHLNLYYFGKVGIAERVCLASTDDLQRIDKHAENPLFTAAMADLDGERVFPAATVRDGGLWYHFYDIGYDYQHPWHPRAYRICAATSRDGVHWTDAPMNPLLTPGPVGAWDDAWVSQAAVVRGGEWWYLLYAGQGAARSNKSGQSIGLARARHPLGAWEKHPRNPILAPAHDEAAWDGAFVQHPCPAWVDGGWRLYYSGFGGDPPSYRVGLAVQQQTNPAAIVDGRKYATA